MIFRSERFLVLAVGTVCGAAILIAPRAALPLDPPALPLTRDDLNHVLDADETALAEAPLSTEERTIWESALEIGTFEIDGEQSIRRNLHAAVLRSSCDQLNAESHQRLLAFAATQFDIAWHDRAATDRERVFGTATSELEAIGALARGHEFAPRVVLRTAYKARINRLCVRASTSGFTELESKIYQGWVALNAPSLDNDDRALRLTLLATHWPDVALEARAGLKLAMGQGSGASELFRRLGSESWSLRWRNYALAAASVARTEAKREVDIAPFIP